MGHFVLVTALNTPYLKIKANYLKINALYLQ